MYVILSTLLFVMSYDAIAYIVRVVSLTEEARGRQRRGSSVPNRVRLLTSLLVSFALPATTRVITTIDNIKIDINTIIIFSSSSSSSRGRLYR